MYQYLVGGLGNQLFQYAMLHYIVSNSSHSPGDFWIDQSGRVDRPFLLGPIVENCTHVRRVSAPYSGARGTVARVLRKIRLERVFPNLAIKEFHESAEYKLEENLNLFQSHNGFWIGYFQHYRYVESVWPTIYPEISKYLDEVQINLTLPDRFLVMHIRGGDFYKLKNSHGVLGVDYYKNAVNHINEIEKISLIVITDDLENAKNIYENLIPDLILGPNDLSEWQTLKLMSIAKYVITANSTFSWWGARIALENDAMILVPDPWFRDQGIEVKTAFYHPKFVLSKSSFLL
jgi:hypothetical protein